MYRRRLYGLFRYLARHLGARALGWRVEGVHHVPADGPLIIASNHVSFLDPVLLSAALPRRIEFMAKYELFAIPLAAALLRGLGAFPVNRKRPGRLPLAHALSILRHGGALGIFPEGKRNDTPVPLPPMPGVGWLAIQGRAPVIPVALTGFCRDSLLGWPIPGQVRIRCGPPILPGERYASADRLWRLSATDDVMRAVRELMDESATIPLEWRWIPTTRPGGL